MLLSKNHPTDRRRWDSRLLTSYMNKSYNVSNDSISHPVSLPQEFECSLQPASIHGSHTPFPASGAKLTSPKNTSKTASLAPWAIPPLFVRVSLTSSLRHSWFSVALHPKAGHSRSMSAFWADCDTRSSSVTKALPSMQPPAQLKVLSTSQVVVSAGVWSAAPAADPALWVPWPALESYSKSSAGSHGNSFPPSEVVKESPND